MNGLQSTDGSSSLWALSSVLGVGVRNGTVCVMLEANMTPEVAKSAIILLIPEAKLSKQWDLSESSRRSILRLSHAGLQTARGAER